MRILVTGSSGFIGFHLVKELLKHNYEVVGVDDHNNYYETSLKEHRRNRLKSNKFSFYKININDLDQIDGKFDIAINLAAQAGVRVSKEKEYLFTSSNVNGFKSFCNFCKKNKVKKIIYASSSSVYCDSKSGKFSELSSPLAPKSKYGLSKLSNELYGSEFIKKYDASMIGLRFFSVYGPYGRPDMAYYSFTNSLKNNTTITLNNEGNMFRDMTYIDDIIAGIIGAIDYVINQKIYNQNELFNLGNDKPIKTTTVLNKIEKYLNLQAKIKFAYTENEAFMTHADINKAKNLLGYDPKHSFDEGIQEFLKWHEEYEKFN